MTTHSTPTAELVLVTPDMAREWLRHNHNNRNIRESKVRTYASEIKSGDFIVTGEGVKFDWNGRLFDGQHRLLSIVAADTPVWMFVFRGLSPEAQKVIDTGSKRSAGDALKFAGIGTDYNMLAALAKVVILWNEGSLRRSGMASPREVTNTEILEFVQENEEESLRWLRAAGRIDNKGKGFPTVSKATLGAALFILHGISPEAAERFASDMEEVRLPGKGHPLNALHGRMTTAKTSRENMRAAGQLFCYFRTWNALATGENLTQLKIGKVAGASGTTAITVPTPKAVRS